MMYQVERRDGYWLYLEERDRAEAEEACKALEIALRANQMRWGLSAPPDLRLVIMTGWWSYIMAAAPLGYKISLILSYPLYARRVARTWKVAGGWQNRYFRRQVVGIKPPRLLEAANRSLGKQVYVQVEDMTEKMRHMVYHEVTHACTSRLNLPAWLNEGLAMITVDKIAGWQTVQGATVEKLGLSPTVMKGRVVRSVDPQMLVPYYVRGYWITRYYDETQPGLLGRLLGRYLGRAAIETTLAQAVGLTREQFWNEIEGKVKAYFLN